MNYYEPQQDYQQYPSQQQYQQYPAAQSTPGYGPQYGHYPAQRAGPFANNPKLIAGVVLTLIGGIGLMIGPFLEFIYLTVPAPGVSWSYSYGYNILSAGEFMYGFLLLVFGILLIIFGVGALFVPTMQKYKIVKHSWIFAVLALIIGIILTAHMLLRASALHSSVEYAYPSFGVWVTAVACIFGIIGEFIILTQYYQRMPKPMGLTTPMGAPQYAQPQQQYPYQQYQQYPQQQYPPQQYPPQYP